MQGGSGAGNGRWLTLPGVMTMITVPFGASGGFNVMAQSTPTIGTADPYLWIKRPSEWDGSCRGALEYALGLVRNGANSEASPAPGG